MTRISTLLRVAAVALLLAAPGAAFAADVLQVGEKQPTNWTAITMFAVFVAFTLYLSLIHI